MTDESPVLCERAGEIAVVRLNRPEKRNAIDRATVDALRAVLGDVEAGDARAVVLTGVGDTFASGADPFA